MTNGNGYPETIGGLGYRFDHEGCSYGQETRRTADTAKKFADDGCPYGQQNRKALDNIDENARWTNRLLVTQLLAIVAAIVIYALVH